MACSLPGPFQKPRRRQGTLAATVRAVLTASSRTLPKADRARAVAAGRAQPEGQAAPAHPSGLGVCSASRRGCVSARACVSAVGGGGPFELLHPSVLLGTH
ncbi:unnamed protein product [Rangifer tarandus platyrhynchus]|uniref:Uncharacterized protein n=1 Tax=Rangifer tarandus platyrhynchus TaxID=3082113 RepID=A0AC59YDC3_RANTA